MKQKSIDLEPRALSILDIPVNNRRCPDFDEDCLGLTKDQARKCRAGGTAFIENKGIWAYTDRAEGYCSLIHV